MRSDARGWVGLGYLRRVYFPDQRDRSSVSLGSFLPVWDGFWNGGGGCCFFGHATRLAGS